MSPFRHRIEGPHNIGDAPRPQKTEPLPETNQTVPPPKDALVMRIRNLSAFWGTRPVVVFDHDDSTWKHGRVVLDMPGHKNLTRDGSLITVKMADGKIIRVPMEARKDGSADIYPLKR